MIALKICKKHAIRYVLGARVDKNPSNTVTEVLNLHCKPAF